MLFLVERLFSLQVDYVDVVAPEHIEGAKVLDRALGNHIRFTKLDTIAPAGQLVESRVENIQLRQVR